MLCTPSPLAEALAIQSHKINRDRFEVIDCKTGRFVFAASEAAGCEVAREMGWVDFQVIPPVPQ